MDEGEVKQVKREIEELKAAQNTTISLPIPLKLELDRTKAEMSATAGYVISYDEFVSGMYAVFLHYVCSMSIEEIKKVVPNFEDIKGFLPDGKKEAE